MHHFPYSKVVAAALLAVCATVQAAAISGQGTWESTLLARDINHDGQADAYYDTSLDLTWLADANVAGRMTWSQALTWAADLKVYGIDGWQLPEIDITGAGRCSYRPEGGAECGYRPTTDSPMAHMYYVTLGNIGYPTPGNGLTNTGPFRNLQPAGYWSNDGWQDPTVAAWDFYMGFGALNYVPPSYPIYAWAVQRGDIASLIAPVPEPSSYALMLAGLASIGFVTYRRRRGMR